MLKSTSEYMHPLQIASRIPGTAALTLESPRRILCIAFMLGLPINAFADNNSSTPTNSSTKREVRSILEEVVVTAQKREESVNEVPIAISAFSGEFLEALGAIDTRDLSKLVPGFTASENGYNTPVYTLRGVGFNDTTYTATSTVGVYVDEVSLPYSIMTKGANLDLERVEVLKGPQGTLFGRNTTGGAINYIANKPSDELDAGVSLRYGRFQTTNMEGYVSGPLTESLAGRIAIRDLQSREGWQYSITRPDDRLGKLDKQSFRATLQWDVTDSLNLNITTSGWRDRSEPQAPQPAYIKSGNPALGDDALAPQVRDHPTIPDSDDPQEADWAPGFDWRLNDSFYNLAIMADWYINDVLRFVSLSGYGKVKSDESLVPGSGLSVVNSEQIIDAQVSTLSQEFRLHGQHATLDWVLGANYNYDDGDEVHTTHVDTISLLFPDPVTGMSSIANFAGAKGETQATASSVFFSSDWQFTEAWGITLGARYTKESRDYEGCSYEPMESSGIGTSNLFTLISLQRAASTGSTPFVIEKGECFTMDETGDPTLFSDTLEENNTALRTVLTWNPNDSALYYASLVRGFKSGGYPVLNGSNKSQLQPVTQERLLSYEIGGKLALLDKAAQLNASIFYYEYTDKQLLTRIIDPVFGPLPILQNAPDSEIRGAELDLQLTPVNGLFVSVAAAYIESQINEFISYNINGEQEDFAGRPFNFAPKLQATALVDYSFPVAQNWDAGIALDYSYTGKTNSTIEEDPNYAHDEAGIVGARLRLTSIDERWGIILAGTNLTNEFSTVGVFQIGDSVARYAGQPRNYSLTLKYQWN